MSEEITADSVSKQQPVDNSQKLILNLLGSGKSRIFMPYVSFPFLFTIMCSLLLSVGFNL
ncbi:hypothetical protein HYC85_015129 [Camellia sinensis]|uniref:Uncharacterized protein n=1 Tax=Camellia sinensis TaxID=4442 RepID=A0A7J7H8A6_CAMSI|nr:hypothetical protein HYC85_015129 [Camellia sinensis]